MARQPGPRCGSLHHGSGRGDKSESEFESKFESKFKSKFKLRKVQKRHRRTNFFVD